MCKGVMETSMRSLRVNKIRLFSFICLCVLLGLVLVFNPSNEVYHWEETSYSNMVKILNENGKSYVIFKKDTCEYCSKLMKKFKVQAKKENLSVFIVDSSKMSEKEKETYMDLFGCEYIPVVYRIKNKNIVNQLVGDTSNNEIRKFVKETK